MIRNTFYAALCASFTSFILLQPHAATAQESDARSGSKFTILHTNDLHGHLTPWRGWEGDLAGKTMGGMDRLGSAVKQVRAEAGAGNVLLLDAGDTLGDTMIADETKGKAIMDAMNALDYTAMVIGNHEPDFSAETLKQRIADAEFPVLAANITEKKRAACTRGLSLLKRSTASKLEFWGLPIRIHRLPRQKKM